MKKVKNLTENKGLINTFKKSKLKNYLNKASLKKKDFFLLKYKKNVFKKGFFFLNKNYFYKNTFKTYFFFNQKKLILNFNFKKNVFFFKTLLIFNNSYFY